MPDTHPKPARATSPALLSLALAVTVVGIIGMGAIWTALNVFTRGFNGWMALPAALDAVLLLRLAALPSGPVRATVAAIATLLTAVVVAYFTVATLFGMALGLSPLTSVAHLGAELAWAVVRNEAGILDAIWLAVAMVLAMRLGR